MTDLDLDNAFESPLRKGLLNRRIEGRMFRMYLLSVYAFRKGNRRERAFYDQYLQLHKEQFKIESVAAN